MSTYVFPLEINQSKDFFFFIKKIKKNKIQIRWTTNGNLIFQESLDEISNEQTKV